MIPTPAVASVSSYWHHSTRLQGETEAEKGSHLHGTPFAKLWRLMEAVLGADSATAQLPGPFKARHHDTGTARTATSNALSSSSH